MSTKDLGERFMRLVDAERAATDAELGRPRAREEARQRREQRLREQAPTHGDRTMIPRLEISAFDRGSPELWPMGVGTPPPRAMTSPMSRWRTDYQWDGDRLTRVVEGIAGRPTTHDRGYRWVDGWLDRTEEYYDLEGEPGDPLSGEDIVTWGPHGPLSTEYRSNQLPYSVWPRLVWDWHSPHRARVTQSYEGKIVYAQTVDYDAAGRLVAYARDNIVPGGGTDGSLERIVEIEWSPDGRILGAGLRKGVDLPTLETITYRWDDRRRLIAHEDSRYGGATSHIYHYDDDPPA